MSSVIAKLLQRVGLRPKRLISQNPMLMAEKSNKCKKKEEKKEKEEKFDPVMNDPIEHATGIEKRELLAVAAGCTDPFGTMKIMKRGPGTKETPNLIPSAFEGRLVGCLCKEHRFAQWMWLERGCPKRCECGFWFKLQEVEPF